MLSVNSADLAAAIEALTLRPHALPGLTDADVAAFARRWGRPLPACAERFLRRFGGEVEAPDDPPGEEAVHVRFWPVEDWRCVEGSPGGRWGWVFADHLLETWCYALCIDLADGEPSCRVRRISPDLPDREWPLAEFLVRAAFDAERLLFEG